MSTDFLTTSEAATLLWEEWKYRHELFWKSLYLWGFASVTVSIFPWINPDVITKLGKNVLIFPIMAGFIALFAAWHLGSEYSRILKVTNKYRIVLGKFAPEPVAKNPWYVRWFFKWSIGKIVPLTFFCFAIVISSLNIIFLLKQISS